MCVYFIWIEEDDLVADSDAYFLESCEYVRWNELSS